MSSQNTLEALEFSNNPALFRILRQLRPETYQLFSYGKQVQVAFFIYEQMAYVVTGNDLELIEQANSAEDAINQWLGAHLTHT